MNTYQKNRLQKLAQNCYYQWGGKEKAKEYYENNKERLQEQALHKYGELSNEEKNIKREYGRNRYGNMTEQDKQKLRDFTIVSIQ